MQAVSKNSKKRKNKKPPMLQVEHRGFAASPAWYALQVGGRETVSTKNAYFCYRNFDVCALFKTVQAFSDLLWLELNQRNRRGAPCSTN